MSGRQYPLDGKVCHGDSIGDFPHVRPSATTYLEFMEKARPLGEILADLTNESEARSAYRADPEGYLSSVGYEGLSSEEAGEAITHFADRLPSEMAEQLAPVVMAHSPATVALGDEYTGLDGNVADMGIAADLSDPLAVLADLPLAEDSDIDPEDLFEDDLPPRAGTSDHDTDHELDDDAGLELDHDTEPELDDDHDTELDHDTGPEFDDDPDHDTEPELDHDTGLELDDDFDDHTELELELGHDTDLELDEPVADTTEIVELDEPVADTPEIVELDEPVADTTEIDSLMDLTDAPEMGDPVEFGETDGSLELEGPDGLD